MGIMCKEESGQSHLYNDKVSYTMTCLLSGQLGQFYYGRRLWHRESFGYPLEFVHRDMVPCVYEDGATFSLEHIKREYPAFGTGDVRHPTYGIGRESGSKVSCSVYRSHTTQGGKPELPDLPVVYVEQDEETQTLELYLEDPVAGMELVLLYIVYENIPVFIRGARFIYRGPEPACSGQAMSLSLNLSDPRYQMVDLTGVWCEERYMDCHGLRRGVQGIYSMRGHSSHQSNPFICLKRLDAGEDSDEVISISPVHSGNFLAQAEMDTTGTVRVTVGIHPEGFGWPLYLGEELQTPKAVVAYLGGGLNDMSQVFRQLYRIRLVRGY